MSFRVLVVDDASFVRDTIKRHLRQLIPDIEIHEAADGRKACSLIKTKNIQLILSDWEMPEMTGQEFLAWLRSEDEYSKIPFIMVTSRGDRDNVVSAVNTGVSDYLSKPFTAEELLRKVAKQLKRLGYRPPSRLAAAQARDGLSPLDALTGERRQATVQKPREVRSAEGFAKPLSSAELVEERPKNQFQGRAYLRFADGAAECRLRDLSLQALSGSIARGDYVPQVFQQAAVDLIARNGAALARINGYVFGVLAADADPNGTELKVNIRFVDDDPAKLDVLAQAISGVI